MQLPVAPWAQKIDVTFKDINSRQSGLKATEIKNRTDEFGPNRLTEVKPKSARQILANQFKSLIVYLLIGAGAVAFAFHEYMEGIAIGIVILLNATIGFVTELRAIRSMEALKKLGGATAKVRRDGEVLEVQAHELVPGDIIILEGGDLIAADMQLITASKLQADESALTGESLPVNKQVDPVDEKTPLAERRNMLYKGTSLTRGSGEALVIATGMQTELGKISTLIQEAEDQSTPLEKRLDKLGQSLVWITLVIAVVVAISGIMAGKEIFLMIETAIALAVAAIPEGLPIVATIALARGMWRMARRNALIRKLSAVETLGATTVIFTDKTGTLTENRMTVKSMVFESGTVEIMSDGFMLDGKPIDPADSELIRRTMDINILCNNASIQVDQNGRTTRAVGDPLEVALLEAVQKAGVDIEGVRSDHAEQKEDAFDSVTKRMATYNPFDGKIRISIKGAIEAILPDCSEVWTDKGPVKLTEDIRAKWRTLNEDMGKQGLRVLALATKDADNPNVDPYKDAAFLGLLGLLDPPREDVKPAMQACHDAGIRVIMVTGDQPVTAKNIGDAVRLTPDGNSRVVHSTSLKSVEDMNADEISETLDVPIFARVSPKQKLDLIALHQKQGQIVAMTGDGVNDAPALKKADIGVAMGLRGTQVAQEAADMVLKDDSFATIVRAIEQGRVIFGNIRKAVQFLLSCNVSEVFAVGLASVVNAPLPILPLQILFLNLVTDVFPALALSIGEGDPQIMKQPPRSPKEPILGKGQWTEIFIYGFVMTVAVLGSLAIAIRAMHMPYEQAVSVSFLTLGFTQLWHVFNMRENGSSFINNDIAKNTTVWAATAMCALLLVGSVYLPGLKDVLKVTDPGQNGWLLILAMSFIPWIAGQIHRSVAK